MSEAMSCAPVDVDWAPLERFATEPEAVAARVVPEEFMWMGTLDTSVGRVHLYKHVTTRGYLHLDADAVCYRLESDCAAVRRVGVSDALVEARLRGSLTSGPA